MDFKGKCEINKMSLVQKDTSQCGVIQETSMELHFVADHYLDLIEMSADQFEALTQDDKIKSFSIGKGSTILSQKMNIVINGYKFTGEEFTSGEVRKQEKTGYITVLKTRVGFDEKFYVDLAVGPNKFLKKVIPISIKSVQQNIEPPGEE